MEKYVLSPYVRFIHNEESRQTMVFHSLFGNPRVVNEEGVNFLKIFQEPIDIKEVQNYVYGNPESIIKLFLEIYFLIQIDEDERKILQMRKEEQLQKVRTKQSLDHVSLSVSNLCNFGCDFCMFFQNDVKERKAFAAEEKDLMSWETAKKCIDTYLKIINDLGVKQARIHFGNAEPLLNWKVIYQSLEYCSKKSGIVFEYAINTNLSLLTEDMAKILKKHHVKIATSLDGLEKANDTVRVYRNGKGTFSKIMEKIDLLEKVGYPIDGINVLLTEKNFHLVNAEIIDFAYQRKMKSIAFDCDLIHCMNIPIAERIQKLIKLKFYANQFGIYFDGTWGIPFRRLMSRSLLNEPYSFCSALEGRGLTFNPDGSLKMCDYSLNTIGHVNQLNDAFSADSKFHHLIENRFPGMDPRCKGCSIEGFCGGLCQIAREVGEKTSSEIIEDTCNFYIEITKALIILSLEKGGDENVETQNKES